jgi:polysaccharide export outer membrane protein
MLRHLVRLAFRRGLCIGALTAACTLAPASSIFAGQAADYVVGPQDVLTITVWDQPDMSGKYSVETDGTLAFPMIGRVKVGGMKIRDVEGEIKKRLADGYFKNPQLSVAIEQYRSQRIFIVGEVRNPGAFPLTGDMTLIEALAHAGSITADASHEAVVVRPRDRAVSGPSLPGQNDAAEVLRVDIKKLSSGALGENIPLRDGDTIFVTRVENIFVLGQVRSPGTYPVQKDTTVLQALSLAGGTTDRGSTTRIKIVRLVNGKRVELKAKVSDVVLAGDTIVVLERIL